MSNKAISVYAEAAKRQKEEEKRPPPGTFAKLMASSPPPKKPKGAENKPKQLPRKKEILQERKQYYNITILQFSDEDIGELKEGAYKVQTFRLSERNLEWFRDTSYNLSKELKSKVTQADILCLSTKIFEKLLKEDKARIKKILGRMK